MVKLRLKRLGAKKNPVYRIIAINSTTKRSGAPIEELGFYNPKTKEMKLNKESALAWIKKGAQPTPTVSYLINNADDEGKLVYKKKEEVKELEAENMKFSQRSHTLIHKQKSLEYKIEQMITKTEISKEEAAEIKDKIK